jgi:hypothetical protein
MAGEIASRLARGLVAKRPHKAPGRRFLHAVSCAAAEAFSRLVVSSATGSSTGLGLPAASPCVIGQLRVLTVLSLPVSLTVAADQNLAGDQSRPLPVTRCTQSEAVN